MSNFQNGCALLAAALAEFEAKEREAELEELQAAAEKASESWTSADGYEYATVEDLREAHNGAHKRIDELQDELDAMSEKYRTICEHLLDGEEDSAAIEAGKTMIREEREKAAREEAERLARHEAERVRQTAQRRAREEAEEAERLARPRRIAERISRQGIAAELAYFRNSPGRRLYDQNEYREAFTVLCAALIIANLPEDMEKLKASLVKQKFVADNLNWDCRRAEELARESVAKFGSIYATGLAA